MIAMLSARLHLMAATVLEYERRLGRLSLYQVQEFRPAGPWQTLLRCVSLALLSPLDAGTKLHENEEKTGSCASRGLSIPLGM